jgi:hypothetical protein
LIPDFEDESFEEIVRLSKISLAEGVLQPSLEYQVALAYRLDAETWKFIIDAFPKLTEFEREVLMNEWV